MASKRRKLPEGLAKASAVERTPQANVVVADAGREIVLKLDASERKLLEALCAERGVTAEVLVREIVLERLAQPKVAPEPVTASAPAPASPTSLPAALLAKLVSRVEAELGRFAWVRRIAPPRI